MTHTRRLASTLTAITIGLTTSLAHADTLKTVNCGANGADLQRAIASAASGSVIQVTGNCARGPYFVFKDVTITGTGAATLSAPGGDRVLHIGGARVGLQHLTINAGGSNFGVIVEERA